MKTESSLLAITVHALAPFDLSPLAVQAFCSSDNETQVISGNYVAQGVFGDHIIYERTFADSNQRWWSLRYDEPREEPNSTKRWIFMYADQRVTIGESIFGLVISDDLSRPG